MSIPATIVIDTKGIIKYANEALLSKSGFALAQVIDRPPKQLWGGHMPAQLYKALWSDISNGLPHVATMKNKSKQGNWYTSEFYIMPITGNENKETLYVGIDMDGNDTKINPNEFLHTWQSDNFYSHQNWWINTFELNSKIDSIYTWVIDTWIDPIQVRFHERYSDAELVIQSQQDSAFFGALYNKYHSEVYHYILSKVYGNTVLAEDLMQETFIKAFQYLNSYTAGYATYHTYLYRIAYTRIVDHMRSNRKKILSLETIADVEYNHSKEYIGKIDLMLFMNKAKEVLTIAEYTAFDAFYIHQDSIHDISIGMARSQNAVKLLLSHARKKLAQGIPRE